MILIVVAMEAEAAPVRDALGLSGEGAGDGTALHPAFPARLYQGTFGGQAVAVASNGVDPRFGVDAIATLPAALTALHAIERCQPELVLSAGTCGGFEARGGTIGQVYLADAVVHHDRRIAIPGWDDYGTGRYPISPFPELAERFGWGTGPVTTGNALDAPEIDLAAMNAEQAVAKDMEAAAVAWVCEHLARRFAALKVVTDLVDHPEPTAEQFDRNLAQATAALAEAVSNFVSAVAFGRNQ